MFWFFGLDKSVMVAAFNETEKAVKEEDSEGETKY